MEGSQPPPNGYDILYQPPKDYHVDGKAFSPVYNGDLTPQGKASREIVAKRVPRITAVSWNIQAPNTSDATWTLLTKILRKGAANVPDSAWNFPPVVVEWNKAPKTLAPYPNKSPLYVAKPKPVPVPKPIIPKPTPVTPPPPPPPPEPKPSIFGNWKFWATLAAIGVYYASESK